jgi:acetoin utilization deacetylase AcuC-like enzyme
MQAFYADQFVLPLPEGHRFPMQKYRLLRDQLRWNLPQVTLLPAPAATDGELALVHSPDYVASLVTGAISPGRMREIGFPWSEAMVERARRSVGATIAAARAALREGVAANLAGGTHHAYADRGGGFCVFNDVAVAARLMQAEWGRRSRRAPMRVAVIDLDVHQGNGTAHIFARDDSVFTLSLHGERNYPFAKEASDLDVALPDGSGDVPYLLALDRALQALSHRFVPDLVLYLAGADPYVEDRLGRLNLSLAGLQTRDQQVFDWCLQRQVPLAFVMAGGYCPQIEDTVQVQLNTYRVAAASWSRWQSLQGDSPDAGKIEAHD